MKPLRYTNTTSILTPTMETKMSRLPSKLPKSRTSTSTTSIRNTTNNHRRFAGYINEPRLPKTYHPTTNLI